MTVLEQLEALAEQVGQRPLMAVKADMIALILENANLDLTPETVFAARFEHYGFLEEFRKRLRRTVIREGHPEMADLAKLLSSTGTANPTVDFGHIGPDWDLLMTEGIVGVAERLKEQNTLYHQSCRQVYEAVLAAFARWAREAREQGNAFVAENLEALAVSAPKTLAQAMQLTVLVYRLIMDLDVCQVRSLGGLDHLYDPFYSKAQDAAHRALTREFLQVLNDQHAVANLPFYVGDTQGRILPYTWVLLEEYRALGLYDPKIHVMYHPDMDPALVRFVLDSIREGKSSYVFINTVAARKSLESIGIQPEDAARLTVYGCYEYAAEATEVPCTCGSYLNMAKALELAMHDGVDVLSGQRVGPATGLEFETFDALLAAVRTQLTHIAEQTMKVLRLHDSRMGDINPALIMSPTYESSITRGLELYSGGAKYNNTSISGVGTATLVDGLMAVKQVVFDRKLVSFGDFREILCKNWEGRERLQNLCKNGCKKFGNNDAEADALAVEMTDLAAGLVNGKENGRGGVFRWGQFSVNIRDTFGKASCASPDGRNESEPLSKNVAASIGQDRKGVTALLSSILKLDAARIPDGAVADVVLHHSAVKGEAGMEAFAGLLTTFMARGGGSIHFNVLSPEVLRKAQAEPEKYRNLQIRLCGWNVRFVNLNKREQDEFILQAEKQS